MSVRRKRIARNTFKSSSGKPRRPKRILVGVLFKTMLAGATVLVMSAVFIFGYDMLTQSVFFEADFIDIRGCRQLSSGDIIEQTGIRPQMNIFSMNLSLTRKKVLAHPWVADAQVSREIPNGIRIRVREHEPLAVLDIGRRFLINRHGDIFKEWQSGDPDQLPLVQGLPLSELNIGEQPYSLSYASIMSVLRYSGRPDACAPLKSLHRIEVDRDIGLTLYLGDGTQTVELGFERYPIKYQRLKQVLDYMTTEKPTTGFRSIDLNDPDRVVIHLSRGDPALTDRKEV